MASARAALAVAASVPVGSAAAGSVSSETSEPLASAVIEPGVFVEVKLYSPYIVSASSHAHKSHSPHILYTDSAAVGAHKYSSPRNPCIYCEYDRARRCHTPHTFYTGSAASHVHRSRSLHTPCTGWVAARGRTASEDCVRAFAWWWSSLAVVCQALSVTVDGCWGRPS